MRNFAECCVDGINMTFSCNTNNTWIDHVLCSADADSLIDSISVLNDVIVSDHRPYHFL